MTYIRYVPTYSYVSSSEYVLRVHVVIRTYGMYYKYVRIIVCVTIIIGASLRE